MASWDTLPAIHMEPESGGPLKRKTGFEDEHQVPCQLVGGVNEGIYCHELKEGTTLVVEHDSEPKSGPKGSEIKVPTTPSRLERVAIKCTTNRWGKPPRLLGQDIARAQ